MGDGTDRTKDDGLTRVRDRNYLSILNRHWYRSCLDSLNEILQETPPDPTLKQIDTLCENILSGFLKAVTGQAPNIGEIQFPADRAYYFPFDNDRVGKFKFSKVFYKLTNFHDIPSTPENNKIYNGSLWSFLPWEIDSVKKEKIKIDPELSVDNSGETISFEKMLTERTESTSLKDRKDLDKLDLLLCKSLLLSGDTDYSDDIIDNEFKTEVMKNINIALASIFEIYRQIPGKPLAESVLMNHVHILRWLRSRVDSKIYNDNNEESLQQEQGYKELYNTFLDSYFFGEISDKEGGFNHENVSVELHDKLVKMLDNKLKDKNESQELIEAIRDKDKSPFFKYIVEPKRLDKPDEDLNVLIRECLNENRSDLVSFDLYFLSSEVENRLSGDLTSSFGEAFLKAGEIKESFVWVTPDFSEFYRNDYRTNESEFFDDKGGTKEKKQLRVKLNFENVRNMALPYRNFFEGIDVALLSKRKYQDLLRSYWRILGDALRESYIFNSSENDGCKLRVPSIVNDSLEQRPQNIFLRVKICDSLNEPVLNGLFVFTKDFDEEKVYGKSHDQRLEDIQDLLAFSKVYFFIVRDYFHALDMARESRDIGRLNQLLYDDRLRELDSIMENRLNSRSFRQTGISKIENRHKFLYETLNQFAYSLIQKPRNIRNETFPFDRILIFPLKRKTNPNHKWFLPFYLFQALFLERSKGVVNGEHYSLMKPFQSPVKEIDLIKAGSKGKLHFKSKSFQEVTFGDKGETELDCYLQKIFLGTIYFDHLNNGCQFEPDLNPDEPTVDSFTLKKSIEESQKIDEEGVELTNDTGIEWASDAIKYFWELYGYRVEKKNHKNEIETKMGTNLDENNIQKYKNSLWLGMLDELTSEYRMFDKAIDLEPDSYQRTASKVQEKFWFLLKFAVVRAILEPLILSEEKDSGYRAMEREYKKQLNLKYDAKEDLNILTLIKDSFDENVKSIDPIQVFNESLMYKLNDGRLAQNFINFNLKGDHLVLSFFSFLSFCAANKFNNKQNEKNQKNGFDSDEFSELMTTWYQPSLTIPVVGAEASFNGGNEVFNQTGKKIGERLLQYKDIKGGGDSISMFIGRVNIAFSESEEKKERFPYVIVMIRDYDDRKSDIQSISKQMEIQLETDLRDFELFTNTYFRNINKFLKDATRREDIQILSTDVTQIARNWYSSGMDEISYALRQKLEHLLLSDEKSRFDRMRFPMVDTLFNRVLEVLLRVEKRDNKDDDFQKSTILIESFPFDRVLHVPLNLNVEEGARLCYARTVIQPSRNFEKKERTSKGDPNNWDGETHRDVYDQIRRFGRRWDEMGGDKVLVQDAKGRPRIFHLGCTANQESDASKALRENTALLFSLIADLVEFNYVDDFIRRLYESHELQRLALCGLMLFLFKLEENNMASARDEPIAKGLLARLGSFRERLEKVLSDSVASAERDFDQEKPVCTKVYMDSGIHLSEIDPGEIESRHKYEGLDPEHFDEWFKKDLGADLKKGFGNASRLPLFRNLFKALESEDYVYGLDGKDGETIASKVFYVYYSLAAPPSFFEKDGFAGRYRGVFCLIVDDSRTASKKEDVENADQQDIKTFIHNAVRYLKQTLDEQALHHQTLKPGLDDVIVGTLHRIKNDLGMPLSVFKEIEDNTSFLMGLKNVKGLTIHSLLNQVKENLGLSENGETNSSVKILSAKNSLLKFKGLFQKLKRLSELKQNVIPIKTYDSNWAGWVFVEKVAAAAGKIVQAAIKSSPRAAVAGKLKKQGEALSKVEAEARGRKEKKSANLTMPDFIQKEIDKLGDMVKELADFMQLPGFNPILSFSVYSSRPLRFYGSLLLEEAFEILTENAFQAFWDYARRFGGKEGGHDSEERKAVLKMVCSQSESERDLVAIQFFNSAGWVAQETRDTLNAETPRPLTNKEHARHSGKEGGSGFGHYYARRIINDYCGGDQWQKRLDIRFDYDEQAGLASNNVALVSSAGKEGRAISVGSLLSNLRRFLKIDIACSDDLTSKLLLFPNTVKLDHFAKVLSDFLNAQAELVAQEFYDDIDRVICRYIRDECDKTRRKAEALLLSHVEQLAVSEEKEALARLLIALKPENQAKIKRGSYRELARILAEISSLTSSIGKVLKKTPNLGWFVGAKSKARSFDPRRFEIHKAEKVRAKANQKLHRHMVYFDSKGEKEPLHFFSSLVELDQDGRPVPKKSKTQGIIRQKKWRVSVESNDKGRKIDFHCSLLIDAAGEKENDRSWPSQRHDPGPCRKVNFGNILLDYRDAILELGSDSRSVGGDLSYEATAYRFTIHFALPVKEGDAKS